MTLREVLTMAKAKRQSGLSDEELVQELNRFEDMVRVEIYDLHEDAPEPIRYTTGDPDVQMQIGSPWDDVYLYLLFSKMDLDNGEIEDYDNDVNLLNAQMDKFRAAYIRTHMPKQRYSIDPFGRRRKGVCGTPF